MGDRGARQPATRGGLGNDVRGTTRWIERGHQMENSGNGGKRVLVDFFVANFFLLVGYFGVRH